MVICFDVGNTDIVFGVFDNGKLIKTSRFRYVKGLSEQEYLPFLQEKMRANDIDCKDISGCVLCCVVQNTAQNLSVALESVFAVTPVSFKNDEKCGLKATIGDINEVGVDIVSACMAAKASFDMPCIVIDMGTATTVTAMDKNSDIRGVSILPGVFTSMWALRDRTALPITDSLPIPKNAIGTDTLESLASGIVLGSAYGLDGMITAFEKELGSPCSVCATGGAAQFIIPHCNKNIVLNDNLLLEGLYCYYKNSII